MERSGVRGYEPALGGSSFVTFSQGAWGAGATSNPCSPGTIRDTTFPSLYPEGVTIGDPANGTATFTTSLAVRDFLPADGGNAPLTGHLVDPTSTTAGVFAGQVLALQLNVGFSDASLGGPCSVAGATRLPPGFGDIVLFNLTVTPSLDGRTVREFLAIANTILGGGATAYSRNEILVVTTELNLSYDDGIPSEWAVEHLGAVGPDTTPPVLTLPSDQIAEASSPAGATVTWTAPTATDLVDGSVGFVYPRLPRDVRGWHHGGDLHGDG